MTAKEARKISEDNNLSKIDSQYKTAISQIEKAVQKGEFKAFLYGSITNETAEKLKLEGYNVENIFERNEDTTVITW